MFSVMTHAWDIPQYAHSKTVLTLFCHVGSQKTFLTVKTVNPISYQVTLSSMNQVVLTAKILNTFSPHTHSAVLIGAPRSLHTDPKLSSVCILKLNAVVGGGLTC